MKTAEEILNQVEPNGELLNTEKCVQAMKKYAKEAINELVKDYKTETFNAIRNGGELRSIDYLANDFINKHL